MANQVSGEGSSEHLYTELRLKSSHDIRILKVLPLSCDNGTIACQMRVASLLEKPEYIALSYTWGPSTDDEITPGISTRPTKSIIANESEVQIIDNLHTWASSDDEVAAFVSGGRTIPIVCNGRQVYVTANLHRFLLRARRHSLVDGKYLWIDALCINQHDQAERTSQVNIMSTIYESARNVIAWLGEQDENTGKAFDLIKALSHCSVADWSQITPKGIGRPDITRILGPCGDGAFWVSMLRFWQRRYFSRVWIIQEITLGKAVVALCGEFSIDWGNIVNMSRFLTVTSWTRWMSDRSPRVQGTHFNYMAPTILNANKNARDRGDKNIMLYCLIRSRRFKASDARDKVYALLGVAGHIVQGKPRLAPIYGDRSVAKTYIDAAIQILQDADDLLLLCCAEGQAFQTVEGLPSWVPDWNCNRVLGLGIVGYARFNAANGLPRSLNIDEHNLRLTIKAARLGSIILQGANKGDIASTQHFLGWATIIRSMQPTYHTGQSRIEVFWRTLITDTGGSPPCHPAPSKYRYAFHAWVHSKVLSHLGTTAAPIEHWGSTGELVSLLEQDRPDSPSDSENAQDDIDGDEYEATFFHAIHLRPFLTNNGYLGLGSESLYKGDDVWIVPGSPVPLVLRPAADAWRVVGGAYVHGFMHGEALEAGLELQDISLV
ncbi:Fc.00g084880.m01.CDS01 [Cosmosporella sp. VM-42]